MLAEHQVSKLTVFSQVVSSEIQVVNVSVTDHNTAREYLP